MHGPMHIESILNAKGNNKAIPLQAWTDPYGSKRFFLQEFLDNRLMKLVKLSSPPLPPPPKKIYLLFSLHNSIA